MFSLFILKDFIRKIKYLLGNIKYSEFSIKENLRFKFFIYILFPTIKYWFLYIFRQQTRK